MNSLVHVYADVTTGSAHSVEGANAMAIISDDVTTASQKRLVMT